MYAPQGISCGVFFCLRLLCLKVLYVSDSKLTPRNFYRQLLDQLGVVAKFTRGDAKRQLHEQVAVMRTVDGMDTVCVCDESHLLSFEMLEEIRFLLNMQFDSVSPLSLILSGQNELWKKLQQQKCTAIRQRIDVQCMLLHNVSDHTDRNGEKRTHCIHKGTYLSACTPL